MTTREGIGTKSSGTAVDCESKGHCLHEGTVVGSLYCCKCGEYISALCKRLGFYEDSYLLGGNCAKRI